MAYGEWVADLEAELLAFLGPERRSAWAGTPDFSGNFLAKAAQGRSTLHDQPWTIEHDDPRAALMVSAYAEGLGVQPLLQRVQRDTVAIRETLLDVEAIEGRIVLRPVYADRVVAESDPSDPESPRKLIEWRRRYVQRAGASELVWCQDVYELGKPARCLTAEGREIEGALGGSPRIGMPHVLYHAARTGALWDPWQEVELYWSSILVAVKRTMGNHILLDASWPQRWSVDVEWQGAALEADETAERLSLTSDPTTILQGRRRAGDGAAPMIGQFQAGGDLLAVDAHIEGCVRQAAASIDLDPSDSSRVTGDPRSGYALSITAEGKKKAQQAYAPVFRVADQQLLGRIAAGMSQIGLGALPTDGYRVRYWFERPGNSPTLDAAKTQNAIQILGLDLPADGKAALLEAVGLSAYHIRRIVAAQTTTETE
jgi:hypothetical protein